MFSAYIFPFPHLMSLSSFCRLQTKLTALYPTLSIGKTITLSISHKVAFKLRKVFVNAQFKL